MQIAIYSMVFLGSALMVFNIYGFIRFTRKVKNLEKVLNNGGSIVLDIPIVLIILFLLGYLTVGIFGNPDLVVSGILFGGSIFVFVIYVILEHIIKRLSENRDLEARLLATEETSRAKTAFLSGISHEIRTPMNAIIGLDNIALRDPDLPPRTREQLEKIGASAKHLLVLINDILDMSRIESGRMVLKSEEFLLRELIDQVNIIINGQCLDKGLRYECNIVGNPGDYYIGDDMKLKQLLINILGNAVKFTEAPGEISLTVEEVNTESGECLLKFVMRDTGIGMDKEYIPKIFEAFSQEDATANNKYGGSGLGMAITKNFVDMMSGDIDIQSEKGVGSVFTVTVKLERSNRRYIAESALNIPEGLRAAVIDNDRVACEHAAAVLDGLNIKADAFTSHKEALEAINKAYKENDPYSIVLADYMAPDMNGLEFTKKLREFDGGETAVILITDYNWDIINDAAWREDGIDSIIAKPLFSDSLLRAVHAVLEAKGGTGKPAEDIQNEPKESRLAGKRILMAEDVDANAEILAELLSLENIESERAENGRIALDMFCSHPAGYYDAILMDMRMPVMDGLTATEKIRAIEREDAKTVPIIAMTANVFDEDVERSRKSGLNAHLSKPIELDKMFDTLAQLIAENGQQ